MNELAHQPMGKEGEEIFPVHHPTETRGKRQPDGSLDSNSDLTLVFTLNVKDFLICFSLFD